ncbi:hypothetical protein L1285_09410 [Pseudoalteromonas sp. DL2-H2.2]|uniref:hypothetical protein n=1 Tax=Pseudoalteromonas sp. DL2-H2.2 TaxID=2908889 RepID=UPI001F4075CD|nr:hypothetical protein [Pseudoalteromonas sp. DL2-H2.2]MCF2908542.1 hypothetical protein [Pseudoalteromonas sp. DL2-H2.2]
MKKELLLSRLSLCLLIISPSVWAVGADCKEPASELDKRVCQSASLKAANEALNVAFHNQRAWLCQEAEILRREDDWDCMAAKEDFWAEQRQWDKAVLAQCKTNDCFTQAYQARIAQINGQDTPLPNFRLTTYGWGDKECQAYLKVLNRTPREDFRGCKLPDLSGSGFTTLPFKPVTAELLKKLDPQIVKSVHSKAFTWKERLNKYQNGHIRMEVANIDINKEGKKEKVIKYSMPSYFCDTWDDGIEMQVKEAQWEALTERQVLDKSIENGFVNFYYKLDGNGNLKALNVKGRNDVVKFGNEFYAVSENKFLTNLEPRRWGGKQEVTILKIELGNVNTTSERWCGFWYNY